MTSLQSIDDYRRAARVEAWRRLAEIERNKALHGTSLETFARDALMVRPKSGDDKLLRFNAAQREIDVRLDNQLHEKGRVRALVLKARQVGVSTYIGPRNYHRDHAQARRPGADRDAPRRRDGESVQRDQALCRQRPARPRVHRSNKEELSFADLDSGITIGAAGASNTGGGRSFTFQPTHLAEVAYRKSASEQALGILEAVPDEDGTEIVQESTANGMTNFWHAQCMAADDIGQRVQQRRRLADPAGQRRAVKIDLLAREGPGLTVRWQVIAVLQDQHMRQKAWTGRPRSIGGDGNGARCTSRQNAWGRIPAPR